MRRNAISAHIKQIKIERSRGSHSIAPTGHLLSSVFARRRKSAIRRDFRGNFAEWRDNNGSIPISESSTSVPLGNIYIYVCVCVCVCVYTYIEREREGTKEGKKWCIAGLETRVAQKNKDSRKDRSLSED